MLFHKHTGTTPGAFRRAASRSLRLLDLAAATDLMPGALPEETARAAEPARP